MTLIKTNVKSPPSLSRFEPLWNLYRCFNQFPVAKNPKSERYLKIYSLIWTIIMSYFLIHSLKVSAEIGVTFAGISGIITFVIIGFAIFTNIVISVEIYCTRKKHANLYNIITEVDQILVKELSVFYDFGKEIKWILRGTILRYLFISTFLVGYLVSSMITKEHNDVNMCVFIPGIANRVFCVLYGNFAEMIRNRLELLLDVLKGMEKERPDSHRHHKIEVIKTAYGKLWTVSKELEECVGLSILIDVILLCSIVTVNIYWILISTLKSAEDIYMTSFGG